MIAKTHASMKKLIHDLEKLPESGEGSLNELYKYVCPEPMFSVSLTKRTGILILHFHRLDQFSVDRDVASVRDADQWVQENILHLSSLGIQEIQYHLTPVGLFKASEPVAELIKAAIKTTILKYLVEYESKTRTESFSEFLTKQAGPDGFIEAVNNLFPNSWANFVKLALVSTGRYREDSDGVIVHV